MLGHLEARATGMTSVPYGIRQSYASKFKLMAIKYTEKKFNAARNLIFVEANIRR
jgi:hypothetical protein